MESTAITTPDARAPGYYADVTAMAQDPADADPDELITVPVVLTVVDGQVVFRSGTVG